VPLGIGKSLVNCDRLVGKPDTDENGIVPLLNVVPSPNLILPLPNVVDTLVP